jgi:predicted alpha-1,2-mannosidase
MNGKPGRLLPALFMKNKFYQTAVLLLLFLFVINKSLSQNIDYTHYVNPFIGTGGHGHTYPGATTPFGFVQLSPDTRTTDWDGCSGYHYSDTTIIGFSHTHLSGTGIGDLGDILLMPYHGKIEVRPGANDKPGVGYHSGFSHGDEQASPGYYSVRLKKHNIKAELTATSHVGFHKYTFPERSSEARILIDLWHGIHTNKSFVAQINIENDSTLSGYRYATGWAELKRIYFIARFSKKFSSSGISLYDQDNLRNIPIALSKEPVRAILTFDVDKGESVLIKVAVSANSLENARQNLNQIEGWDFVKIKEEARKDWNRHLSAISVEGEKEQKAIFYTALYHNLVVPNRISDSDKSFFGPDLMYHKSQSVNYYSTFSLWDTFRATHPLYTILYPEKVSEFINSFIQHHELYGYLPIWPLWGTETHTMIGNHAIPVIAEAYKKGIRGFDAEKAYAAMKQSSLRNHTNCYFDTLEKYQYLPSDRGSQTVSKTLEIAYDDWCVAKMAEALGKSRDTGYFMNRSGFYKNVFDSSTGFMRGRSSNGEWTKKFNPLMTSYAGDYTEGNAWQYSFFVPHDIEGLIRLHGGKENFSRKVDSLFTIDSKLVGDVLDVTGLIGQYAHGNEPSHHIAYLFNYAGQPQKTRHYVREILRTMYSNTPEGLIGNEDCGQMSAWYIFSSIGFYPVNPVSARYDLGWPIFEKTTIKLPDKKQFIIIAKNVNGKNKYVQKVLLNGKLYDKLYISHNDIMKGGKLEFVIGKQD